MKIRFDNVWARVVEGDAHELEWLAEYTSCEQRVWRQSINWRPDRRYHMFDRAKGLLPAGFMKLLKSAAARDGVSLVLDDRRVKPVEAELDESLVEWLYDYQKAACWDVIRKGGRGLVKVPTGGGKTEIFIGLSRLISCEWLFVVHRADLVGQTVRRFAKRTGERAGVWDGRWQKGTSNVTVATFQGLHHAKRKGNPHLQEFLDSMGGVNVDEVHAQPADSFYGITLDLKNAYYRVGMSGTPLDRSDKDNLRSIGAVGPILYEIPYELLQSRGVLSKSKVAMVRYEMPGIKHDSTWNQVYRDMIVRNSERNELLAKMAVKAKKPCLFFVEQFDHGKRMKAAMEKKGLKVDFAHGQHWVDHRQRKIQSLVDGDVDVLLCTVIFQEGVDIPSLRSVVVGGGKASIVAALQRIGRGMRTDEVTGKTTFEVWDVFDRGHRWLSKHATGRWNAYLGAGHDPKMIRATSLGKTVKAPKTVSAGVNDSL